MVAILVECGWEVVENTSWIINKYRESTLSLEYYGDSIVNSVADIGACALGYTVAATLPVMASVVGFVSIECVMLMLIRDSFLLNVIMLVYPLEAIKQWQLGGVTLLLSCRIRQSVFCGVDAGILLVTGYNGGSTKWSIRNLKHHAQELDDEAQRVSIGGIAGRTAILLCADGSNRAAVKIASAGANKAIVVVAPNATVPEKHAAGESASFLKQVIGAVS